MLYMQAPPSSQNCVAKVRSAHSYGGCQRDERSYEHGTICNYRVELQSLTPPERPTYYHTTLARQAVCGSRDKHAP